MSCFQTYYNVGNMVYALLGSAVFLFILMAGLLFLLYWPPTRSIMNLVLAWGIGLVSINCPVLSGVVTALASRTLFTPGYYRWSENDINYVLWLKLLEWILPQTSLCCEYFLACIRMLAYRVSRSNEASQSDAVFCYYMLTQMGLHLVIGWAEES